MPEEKQANIAAAKSTTPTTTSRQRPGSACEECRRRKLRCDRQPQCGNCVESGVICTTTTVRPARGPKKGHLKALKGRIATLERCIMEQQGGISLPVSDGSLSPVEEVQHQCSSDGENGQEVQKIIDLRRASLPSPIEYQNNSIPELVRADLDQLYFERVHPLVPVIQRTRYFTWAKLPTKSDSRSCLQYAMWTLAASLSTHCQSIRDSLYTETKKKLEALESRENEMDLFDIEEAQAWLLLAIYQFTRTTYRKGWMSAGRLIRLVQLMRLYELDSPTDMSNQLIEPEWVEVEEKRRTFWMAYTLDRFANIRKGWPITLTEQILTRLPIPEAEFQSGQPMVMGFLSDSLAGSEFNLAPQSSFSECIILATLCGRSLSHQHLSMVDGIYGTNPQEFWGRHEWIDAALSTRISILSLTYPFQLEHMDPMLLFTKMIAQATILCMQKIIESIAWDSDDYAGLILEYEQRARLAAKEIVELAKALTHLSYFKVHPFTPIPLCICAEFLNTRDREMDPTIGTQLQEILDALQYLKNVNALAKENPMFPLWSDFNMGALGFGPMKQ
ncbi:putative transcriptional regulatory protein C777,02 [Talaromyces islandicus]|uniref:Putative transcriptional regulatory protein C777,02 n=1 Tax=Talaromyces islandicus TaxID=28573 RepID=A0A0U1M846_TALIS|nr:putative transcriptional regulatory protein C777,02 [Talaromyces islandicus]